MANFDIAYKITSGNEGGFMNDPNDSGGETYAGITRKNFPKWKGWVVIDKRKPSKGTIYTDLEPLVRTFYKSQFWDTISGDSIKEQELANDAYDMGINAGLSAARELLKQSL